MAKRMKNIKIVPHKTNKEVMIEGDYYDDGEYVTSLSKTIRVIGKTKTQIINEFKYYIYNTTNEIAAPQIIDMPDQIADYDIKALTENQMKTIQ